MTVFRAVASAFFRRIVTGPEAPDQVRLNVLPAVIPTNAAGPMVNSTAALTAAKATEAKSARVKSILSII